MRRLLVAVFALWCAIGGGAHAAEGAGWGDWAGRQKITLQAGKPGVEIKSAVGPVPVLVRLHSGNFNQFLNVKEDGSDLRFVAADEKTILPYHIELFDPINELALIWVQYPSIVPNQENALWMYYGNPKAPSVADPAATYDANQVAVYHFNGTGGAQDATRNANPIQATNVEAQPASLIGAGIRLSGNGNLTLAATPSLAWHESGFTFSTWIKLAAPEKDAVILSRREGDNIFVLGINGTGLYLRYPHAAAPIVSGNAVLTPGQWHHLALVGGAQTKVYLDGREVLSNAAPSPPLQGEIEIGAIGGKQFLHADLDEVEFSNIARSPDWIKVAAKGQGIDASLLSYGEAAKAAESTSYFISILRSVTVDGWAIILLLAVMLVLSWWVMVNKAVAVSRMQKDNDEFLTSFHKLANDPGALDRDEDDTTRAVSFGNTLFGAHAHYQNSPLYRIYHIGVQEIKHRFGKTDPRELHGKSLTPQAVNAIRASLDATLVRETQKLNRMMVIVTIAISGGPFLGLLGTVVGVMITFAAIAATGDVNINAIAPGIAGALVATVAGLAVAIPALFGYNYLVTRIKDMSVDMQVFVDEFISKVAEHYACDVRIDHEDASRKRAV